MKEAYLKCHTTPSVEKYYAEAEKVVESTNALVAEADQIMKGLHADGLLTPEPFDEPIEYEYFDMWHYYGRTAKHGAFMGGADFVQWHGFYELVNKLTSIKQAAKDLRERSKDADPAAAAGSG